MSKSKGNILDPLEIIKQYGWSIEILFDKRSFFWQWWKYFSGKIRRFINSDLANNFGNLCQRVSAFTIKNCNSKIPENLVPKDDMKILNEYSKNLDIIRFEIDNQNINYYI